MRLPDHDLQLLEAYLDDELSADETDALRDRLIEEPGMADALAELRQGRELRQQVFTAMEPGGLAVGDTVADVQRAIRGHMRWDDRLRRARRYITAAACITFGVMIGIGSRASQTHTVQPNGAVPVAVAGGAGGSRTYVAQQPPVNNNIAYVDQSGDTTTISWPVIPNQPRTALRPTLPVATPRMVVLTDERGTIIAAQQFESVAEAREFVDDLRRAAEASGHTILPIGPSSMPAGFGPAQQGPAPSNTSLVVDQF